MRAESGVIDERMAGGKRVTDTLRNRAPRGLERGDQ
jgi:hypothetical protein